MYHKEGKENAAVIHNLTESTPTRSRLQCGRNDNN